MWFCGKSYFAAPGLDHSVKFEIEVLLYIENCDMKYEPKMTTHMVWTWKQVKKQNKCPHASSFCLYHMTCHQHAIFDMYVVMSCGSHIWYRKWSKIVHSIDNCLMHQNKKHPDTFLSHCICVIFDHDIHLIHKISHMKSQ